MTSRTQVVPTRSLPRPIRRGATRLPLAIVISTALVGAASCTDGQRVIGPLSPIRLPVGHQARYDSVAALERKQSLPVLGSLSASPSRTVIRTGRALTALADAADPAMTVTSIPFNPEQLTLATVMPECDDCMFGELDANGVPTGNGLKIGFDFTFFGNSYNEIWYSTNGFIGFRQQDNGCCDGSTIPAGVEPGGYEINDIIAYAWTDLMPMLGQVTYTTRGTAPNRRFILDLKDVEILGEDGKKVSTQVILYEGSNAIEIHTLQLPQTTQRVLTQGVENSTGTEAAFVQGRVAARFALDGDAVRFAPAGTGSNRVPSVDPGGNAGGPPVDRYVGVEGTPITFKATGSDADSDPLTFAWDFNADGVTDAQTADGSYTYPESGKYLARVTVSDPHGQSATASIDVYVENAPPSAELNAPEAVDEGSPILLSVGQVVDPSKGDQAGGFEFAFDCGEGFGAYGSATSASCSTVDNGRRTVGLKVRDRDGGEGMQTKSVEIRNVAPSVDAGTPLTALSGQLVTLVGQFSDLGVNDRVWNWAWSAPSQGVAISSQSWSGGSSSEQGPVSGQYRACGAGPQMITLAVTDKDGGRGEGYVTLTVQPLAVNIRVQPSAIALRDRDRDSDSDDVDSDGYSDGHGRVVTVYLFSSEGFDATSIDPASVRLTNGVGKGTPLAVKKKRRSTEWDMRSAHLNADRLRDLKLRFNRKALVANGDLTPTTTSLTLVARAGGCASVTATGPVVLKP